MKKYTLERFEKTISLKEYKENYVNIEEFLEYCKECPNYDNYWACPSYDFDVNMYWDRFKTVIIVGYKISFLEEASPEEGYEILKYVKKDMAKELYKMEKDYPDSISLSAGSCDICGKGNCTKPQGEPCRFPEKMRYSIESLGGNVGKTVHDILGIPLEWVEEGKLPSYFVLVGGLLV